MRTGLAVMRSQPAHLMHLEILYGISKECDVTLMGLGSTGNDIDEQNPWNQIQRTQMIRNVFGDRVVVIPLEDLPKNKKQNQNDWVEYVLEMCKTFGYPDVTDYYSGHVSDAVWYQDYFYNEAFEYPTSNPQDLRKMDNGEFRRLHIIDRDKNDCPSATEIRTLISMDNDEWKKWVPAVNHDFIINTFPEKFKIKR